jgi:hypothetical protein
MRVFRRISLAAKILTCARRGVTRRFFFRLGPGVFTLLLMACAPEATPPVDVVDAPQEKLFSDCVAARDRQIHQEVFATVDNPDVQRELLATQKERAVKECRQQYPR